MSHGQVWANGCKSRSPGPFPSWPDTRQFWSWSHIPHVSTHTVDCDSVWVPRMLANKASLLLFIKLYRCHGKVLTATGEGGINTSLTGSKLLFWPQNKQTNKQNCFSPSLEFPFWRTLHQREKAPGFPGLESEGTCMWKRRKEPQSSPLLVQLEAFSSLRGWPQIL